LHEAGVLETLQGQLLERGVHLGEVQHAPYIEDLPHSFRLVGEQSLDQANEDGLAFFLEEVDKQVYGLQVG